MIFLYNMQFLIGIIQHTSPCCCFWKKTRERERGSRRIHQSTLLPGSHVVQLSLGACRVEPNNTTSFLMAVGSQHQPWMPGPMLKCTSYWDIHSSCISGMQMPLQIVTLHRRVLPESPVRLGQILGQRAPVQPQCTTWAAATLCAGDGHTSSIDKTTFNPSPSYLPVIPTPFTSQDLSFCIYKIKTMPTW